MSGIPNYVRCRVTGEACIRFLNLCRNNGIDLKQLVTNENSYEMDIRAEDFKKLRPIVRKTRVKIHILNRRGPAFFFIGIVIVSGS